MHAEAYKASGDPVVSLWKSAFAPLAALFRRSLLIPVVHAWQVYISYLFLKGLPCLLRVAGILGTLTEDSKVLDGYFCAWEIA